MEAYEVAPYGSDPSARHYITMASLSVRQPRQAMVGPRVRYEADHRGNPVLRDMRSSAGDRMTGMINDLVPTGFSSVAAMKLLKTMDATMETNSSFLATANSTAFDTTSQKTLSGDTMFSIIAAAASTKATPPPSDKASSDKTGSQSTTGEVALAKDPYHQKSYTIEEAAQNYYAFQNMVANSFRTAGGETDNLSNGQILAEQEGFQGQQAAEFANAFDNQTLKVSDAASLNVDAKYTETFFKSADGNISGNSESTSVNSTAWRSYLDKNPNTIWTGDFGYKGSSSGLIFSW